MVFGTPGISIANCKAKRHSKTACGSLTTHIDANEKGVQRRFLDDVNDHFYRRRDWLRQMCEKSEDYPLLNQVSTIRGLDDFLFTKDVQSKLFEQPIFDIVFEYDD